MIKCSPLDGKRSHIEKWLREGQSYRAIAESVARLYDIATTSASIGRADKRWGMPSQGKARPDPESFASSDDEVSFTTAPSTEVDQINELLLERGLKPEDWERTTLKLNKWGNPTPGEDPLKQITAHFKRKKALNLVIPARVSLGKINSAITHLSEFDSELIVFVGDQHAPYQDPELHKLFCAFLNAEGVHRGVLMGDLLDLPTISRHPKDPDWAAEVQECVDAGAQILLDYRQAGPGTAWVKLTGNHEERLRRAQINNLGEMYGVRPAKVTGLKDLPPCYEPGYLLRLDELEIEPIPTHGKYNLTSHMVTPLLAAKHGDKASKGSGTTPRTELDRIDHSIVIGHTHRQSLVQKTRHQINGNGHLLRAAETGCMCKIENGLGYAPEPDWSNGFATATVWPDGTFQLDLATFVDGRLYWRNKRY